MRNFKVVLAVAPVLLCSCTTVPLDAETKGVAIGQPTTISAVRATPLEVVEDSRCAVDVRCVWAGRIIVRTQFDGDGWKETSDLVLGASHLTHGTSVALVAATPEPRSDRRIEPQDYRFIYEAR